MVVRVMDLKFDQRVCGILYWGPHSSGFESELYISSLAELRLIVCLPRKGKGRSPFKADVSAARDSRARRSRGCGVCVCVFSLLYRHKKYSNAPGRALGWAWRDSYYALASVCAEKGVCVCSPCYIGTKNMRACGSRCPWAVSAVCRSTSIYLSTSYKLTPKSFKA